MIDTDRQCAVSRAGLSGILSQNLGGGGTFRGAIPGNATEAMLGWMALAPASISR